MKFTSIQDQQIAYLAGIQVDIDRLYSFVEIYVLCEGGKKSIVLQDYQADDFINLVDQLIELYCDETEGHELLAAYPYGDLIAELPINA